MTWVGDESDSHDKYEECDHNKYVEWDFHSMTIKDYGFFHEEWDIRSVATSSTPYLAQMCY